MRRFMLCSPIILAFLPCWDIHGQSAPANPERIPVKNLPLVPSTVYDGMRAAYYHPGKISLECDGSFDFSGVMAKAGVAMDSERVKALSDLQLHVKTGEGMPTSLAFRWPSTLSEQTRAQIEGGANQMVKGFFQTYWPFVNAEFLPGPKDNAKLMKLLDGGYSIEMQAPPNEVHVTVDSSMLLSRVQIHSTLGQDSDLKFTFTPSSNPQPGDRARFTGISSNETIGTSTRIQAVMTWDEQDVGGFHFPHRISIAVPGAFDLPVTLAPCSVSQTIEVAAPPQ